MAGEKTHTLARAGNTAWISLPVKNLYKTSKYRTKSRNLDIQGTLVKFSIDWNWMTTVCLFVCLKIVIKKIRLMEMD